MVFSQSVYGTETRYAVNVQYDKPLVPTYIPTIMTGTELPNVLKTGQSSVAGTSYSWQETLFFSNASEFRILSDGTDKLQFGPGYITYSLIFLEAGGVDATKINATNVFKVPIAGKLFGITSMDATGKKFSAIVYDTLNLKGSYGATSFGHEIIVESLSSDTAKLRVDGKSQVVASGETVQIPGIPNFIITLLSIQNGVAKIQTTDNNPQEFVDGSNFPGESNWVFELSAVTSKINVKNSKSSNDDLYGNIVAKNRAMIFANNYFAISTVPLNTFNIAIVIDSVSSIHPENFLKSFDTSTQYFILNADQRRDSDLSITFKKGPSMINPVKSVSEYSQGVLKYKIVPPREFDGESYFYAYDNVYKKFYAAKGSELFNRTYTMTLYKQWNLIGNPLSTPVPVEYLVDNCNTEPGASTIKEKNTWTYVLTSDNGAISPGEGYFIKSLQTVPECTVILRGTPNTQPKTVQLFASNYKGWDLISGDMLVKTKASGCKIEKGPRTIGLNGVIDNVDKLEPTKGYAIKVSSDCTLTLIGTGSGVPLGQFSRAMLRSLSQVSNVV